LSREAALTSLVAGDPVPALNGIRELSQDMCREVMVYYSADPGGRLPGVIVFDGDTYCAMDVSVAWGIPRVARVGTGPRDAYTTPTSIPIFSSGLPPDMSLFQRAINTLSLLLSRLLIAPYLLPWLYSGHRNAWAEWVRERHGEAAAATSKNISAHLPAFTLGNSPNVSMGWELPFMKAHLPWDGWPTLFNTHWGLEPPRSLAPYEHLIGHTNDFEGDGRKPLSKGLLAWLASSNTPVVYVGLGTLSILSHATLLSLSEALLASSHEVRYVWSVPTSQHSLLPSRLRLASERAACALGGLESSSPVSSQSCEAGGASSSPNSTTSSILLLPWAPQLSLLLEEGVSAFVTHGGMNGVAEGVYARLPLLCVPLFSDQPDNCARAEHKGFAKSLTLSPSLTPSQWWGALGPLLASSPNPASGEEERSATMTGALQEAWVRNIGAGGAHRAVAIIEETASLAYSSHISALVPREHFWPWYKRWAWDVFFLLALFSTGFLLFLWLLLHALVWTCRGEGSGVGGVGKNTS